MNAKEFFTKHGSAILSVVASAGVIFTAVLAAKAVPTAKQIIEDAEKEKYAPLTDFEKVQVSWKAFVPAGACGLATVGCIIGANMLSSKQVAKLSAGYAALDQMYKRYKDNVRELVQDTDVQNAIDHMQYTRDSDDPKFYENTSEERLFMINDGTEDRYFYSTMEKFYKARYNVNMELARDGIVPLSDFYKDMNLSDANGSEFLGWTWDMMADWYGEVWIDIEARVHESNDDDPDNPGYVEIILYQEPAAGYEDDCYEDYFMHKNDCLLQCV